MHGSCRLSASKLGTPRKFFMRAGCAILWLALAAPLVSSRRTMLRERWDLSDLRSINQEHTRKGPVLPPETLKRMQKLADSQGGSTVHRYSQEEADERLFAYMDRESLPALVNATLIIREQSRKTRSQHASTLAEVQPGVILAAWFGGTYERMADVGIWMARYHNDQWSSPRQMAWPKQAPGSDVWKPCWNPVLLHVPEMNSTFLYYKVGLRAPKLASGHHDSLLSSVVQVSLGCPSLLPISALAFRWESMCQAGNPTCDNPMMEE